MILWWSHTEIRESKKKGERERERGIKERELRRCLQKLFSANVGRCGLAKLSPSWLVGEGSLPPRPFAEYKKVRVTNRQTDRQIGVGVMHNLQMILMLLLLVSLLVTSAVSPALLSADWWLPAAEQVPQMQTHPSMIQQTEHLVCEMIATGLC